MFQRCLDKEHPAYSLYGGNGVVIFKEWYNFQNFADWYTSQPNYGKAGYHLDKDLSKIGNKVYCPEYCWIIPPKINNLLPKILRGSYPLGVCFNTQTNKFKAAVYNAQGNSINLGDWGTPEEAFYVYKVRKEEIIKQVAHEFKCELNDSIYNNLINYEVHPYPSIDYENNCWINSPR